MINYIILHQLLFVVHLQVPQRGFFGDLQLDLGCTLGGSIFGFSTGPLKVVHPKVKIKVKIWNQKII